jgi:predicted RNA binding protein YcfA (HicA-like mRNA interferase family)
MSSKLPRITATDLQRALEGDGWYVVRQEGSHVQLKHPIKPGRVTVAVHKRQIIDPKTLRSALRQAGMTVDELRGLL